MTINEDYSKYLENEKKKNSAWSRFSKNVNPIYVILFFITLFVGHYLNTTGKLPSGLYWGIVIALAIVIIILITRPSKEPILIPEHIIKKIAHDALEAKRLRGEEIPFNAKIKVNLVGEIIYKNDVLSGTGDIIKREVGFEMIQKGYRQKGIIGVHPYNGTILGIRLIKTGYDGTQTKDRIIIPVSVIGNSQQSMIDNKSV